MGRDGTMLARNGEAISVHGWEPGNGTRYDLTFARRAGGGWFVAWPEAGLIGLVRFRDGGMVSIESRGQSWIDGDLEVVTDLAAKLYDGGAL